MRQPATVKWTPSRPSPWYGAARDGDRFTAQQIAALAGRGDSPDTCEAITVRRPASMEEMWWPIGQAAPVFEFDCPVVQRLADGRVKVIAPSGENKIVLGDGWVRRPKAPTGWGRISR